jgi:hypothetical protein
MIDQAPRGSMRWEPRAARFSLDVIGQFAVLVASGWGVIQGFRAGLVTDRAGSYPPGGVCRAAVALLGWLGGVLREDRAGLRVKARRPASV